MTCNLYITKNPEMTPKCPQTGPKGLQGAPRGLPLFSCCGIQGPHFPFVGSRARAVDTIALALLPTKGKYSIFLELRSPLVRGTPILDLSFLGPSEPHGALKVASRLIKPRKNAGFGVWGSGLGFPL